MRCKDSLSTHSRARLVPPSPRVMTELYQEYCRVAEELGLSFPAYLRLIGFTDPSKDISGMDDSMHVRMDAVGGPQLVSIPDQRITGTVRVKVLLVDFEDQIAGQPAGRYQDLLFSKGTHATGSMRDYYHEVTLEQVDIVGTVHGWFRMPRPYSFYTNGESGTERDSYPRNAQGMAEDAVRVAMENGVTFEPELDVLNEGVVTALFIVHAGRGAEELNPAIRGGDIWSHKWSMPNPVEVAPGLTAAIYLTVPEDCRLGVCAHELGHLVFQWEDFYDPNYDEDGESWDGSGVWDLMAGGSYNGGSDSPAHPAAMHKAHHDWIAVDEVRGSSSVTLEAYTATAGRAVKIVSPAYGPGQYLLLENRAAFGFDRALPGHGLLVWRVDEFRPQTSPDRPALMLIQADGRHDLSETGDRNSGDPGDPFPGSAQRTELTDSGSISTSFDEGERSGVTLRNIRLDPQTRAVSLDIAFAEEEVGEPQDLATRTSTPMRDIPDRDEGGIRDTIMFPESGIVSAVSVTVDITHTYIGDLRIELVAPSGERAILHNGTGRDTRDLRRTYSSAATPSLGALVGNAIGGEWAIEIFDLGRFDVGRLNEWTLAIAFNQASDHVEEESAPHRTIPDADPAGISDTIGISRSGRVRSIDVDVDIAHGFVGDLRVELVGPSLARALLHNMTAQAEPNLRRSYSSREDAALGDLIGSPARGNWTLRVSDLVARDTGTLNRWQLRLGLASGSQIVRREASPGLSIPDDDAAGIGSTIPIDVTGSVQFLKVAVNIQHSYIGDLRLELIAPGGARAVLHDRTGRDTRNLVQSFQSDPASPLSAMIGQPARGNWVLRVMDLEGADVGVLRDWSLEIAYVG